jgi:hypothetical protein
VLGRRLSLSKRYIVFGDFDDDNNYTFPGFPVFPPARVRASTGSDVSFVASLQKVVCDRPLRFCFLSELLFEFLTIVFF